MKAFVLGAVHMKGTSEKTGKPYDFYQVNICSPIEPIATPKMEKTGFGMEVQQLPLNPVAYNKFAQVQAMLPCELELITDVVPRFGRMQTEVVDVRPVQNVQKVA